MAEVIKKPEWHLQGNLNGSSGFKRTEYIISSDYIIRYNLLRGSWQSPHWTATYTAWNPFWEKTQWMLLFKMKSCFVFCCFFYLLWKSYLDNLSIESKSGINTLGILLSKLSTIDFSEATISCFQSCFIGCSCRLHHLPKGSDKYNVCLLCRWMFHAVCWMCKSVFTLPVFDTRQFSRQMRESHKATFPWKIAYSHAGFAGTSVLIFCVLPTTVGLVWFLALNEWNTCSHHTVNLVEHGPHVLWPCPYCRNQASVQTLSPLSSPLSPPFPAFQ